MDTITQTMTTEDAIEHDPLFRDFKAAMFIVSVLVNVAILTTWIALQIYA